MSVDLRVTRATLTSQVEEALRIDIVEGVLSPGQRLRAAELSARYGVSPTPLREALQRLAAQNLIDWDPRLGATVAEVSATELRDIYAMRELLESLALQRSIENGDKAWEEGMAVAWQRFKSTKKPGRNATRDEAVAWSQAHRSFHESLFAACGSGWLLRFVGMLADHSERYRVLSARSGIRDAQEEHEAILRAAISHDAGAAVRALEIHLANTIEVVEQDWAKATAGK